MSLPNEILLATFETLDNADLKAVRLVSKAWSTAASMHLFTTLYVSPNDEDLSVFRAVAEHPLLSQSVRCLSYDATTFVSSMTKKTYIQDLCMDRPTECFSKVDEVTCNDPDPDIQAFIHHNYGLADQPAHVRFRDCDFVNVGLRKYKEHARCQRKLLASGLFVDTVVGGLKKLSSLRAVTLVGKWQRLRKLDERYTGSPLARSWNVFHCTPQAWTWGDLDVESHGNDGAEHYKILTSSLVTASRQIQSFKISGHGYSCGLPPYIYASGTGAWMPFPRSDATAFAGLKTFSLTLAAYREETAQLGDSDDEQATCEQFSDIAALPALLGLMHTLENLDLRMSIHMDDPPRLYKYHQVFPERSCWKHLESFRIENLAIAANDFVDLVTKRMPKLRRLILDHVDLLEGNWESVFQTLAEMKPPLILDFTREDDNYLFHRGEDFWEEIYPETLFRDLRQYVAHGGRHPCLPDGEPDSAAARIFPSYL